jgi:hypothetical protein
MRIAGQLISGYVLSVGHGKTQNLNVYGEVMPASSTAAAEQELSRALFLAGYNGDSAAGMEIFNSSGSFTIPTGVNSITVIAAGGGGTSGANAGSTLFGGKGGAGGLAIAQISVTAGQVLSVTVGTNGLLAARTSSVAVSGTPIVSATGGANGTSAVSGNDFTPAKSGVTGIAGTGSSSQPNSVVYSGNVGTPEWSTKLLALRHKFIGSAFASFRQQLITMGDQQYNNVTGTWSAAGVDRPGCGGAAGSNAGTSGAVIIIY